MDKLAVLGKSDLFRDLDSEQLKKIAEMCITKTYEPGEIIGRQGQKLDDINVIAEGLIAIIIETGPLAQRQVQAASNFDVVGWSAMIEPRISSATGKALEKTTVYTFKGQELCEICTSEPKIGCKICKGVARVVATRLSHAYTQLLGVTGQD